MGSRRMLAVALAIGGALAVAPAAMAAGGPTATIGSPVNVTWSGATLTGTLDPGSASTDYHFEWDQQGSPFCNNPGTGAPAHVEFTRQRAGGSGAAGVSQAITGLMGKTTYCFRLVATSSLGSSTTSLATFMTPPMPPETTLFSRPVGLVTTRTVSFGFNSNVDGSTFECSRDGSEFAACTSPATYTDVPDGDHVFEVRAIDPDGLTDPTPAVSNFRVAAAATGGTTTGGGSPAGGTPTSGGGSTAPAPVTVAPKVGRGGKAKLAGSKLLTGQRVSCAGDGPACAVTVKLFAAPKQGSKKLVGVGSSRLSVAAGAASEIAVKLNGKGRKLLKRAGKLKVIASVVVKRGARIPVTSDAKFNVKAPKKHKKH
jgi:hypothetical protein